MNIEKELERIENEEGFISHNNYHIINKTKDNLTIRADLTKTANNPYGFAHGGFIFGLGDTVMGMLAAHQGKKAITVESNISYLKQGTGKYLLAQAEIVKEGKSICFLKSNIYNDKEDLIAILTSTYYYIKEEKEGI